MWLKLSTLQYSGWSGLSGRPNLSTWVLTRGNLLCGWLVRCRCQCGRRVRKMQYCWLWRWRKRANAKRDGGLHGLWELEKGKDRSAPKAVTKEHSPRFFTLPYPPTASSSSAVVPSGLARVWGRSSLHGSLTSRSPKVAFLSGSGINPLVRMPWGLQPHSQLTSFLLLPFWLWPSFSRFCDQCVSLDLSFFIRSPKPPENENAQVIKHTDSEPFIGKWSSRPGRNIEISYIYKWWGELRKASNSLVGLE